MLNPYSIILELFIFAGLLATIWGLLIIIRARETRHWPHVDGVIEESDKSSESNDLLPHIVFSYIIGVKNYQQVMEFPADVTPSQEFAESYAKKYPAGSKIPVYYAPDNPERVTLEPGLGKGDWLVFAIGFVTLIFGLLFFFFGGY